MTDPKPRKPLAPSVRAMLARRRMCTRCNGQGWYRSGVVVVAPCPICYGTGRDPGNRR